ncbi:hypothetical protein AKJ41_06225 [candidate division MSBL1 archaeon SCGC-AAA259O05]|uniref:Uncharacterized protein n=1 Tax=candidate division MSBL1 archaeon SCGC-AAA259O05 TaxID=1698271 RepID=A0A133UXQ3_9EURY|nr:hypothetical protein AKJ41_06225 [candidate division MSBL1 archaeon SCGC-AAA259O05]
MVPFLASIFCFTSLFIVSNSVLASFSDFFEDTELIVGNGLVVLLAKPRAVEEGRKVQPGDLQWSSERLKEDKNFLKEIADTI